MDSAGEARRTARAGWPVRKFRLEDAPGPDLSATTTAEERLAMMWPHPMLINVGSITLAVFNAANAV